MSARRNNNVTGLIMNGNMAAVAAEGLGMFILTVGTAIAFHNAGYAPVTIGLANFASALVAVALTIHITGAQLHPYITIGSTLLGLQKWSEMFFVLVGQAAGTVIGGLTVWWIVGCSTYAGREGDVLGTPHIADGVKVIRALGAEFVFAGLYVLIYYVIIDHTRSVLKKKFGDERLIYQMLYLSLMYLTGVLAFAATYGAAGFAIGGLTGAAVNPMRHLGTALPGLACSTSSFRSTDWIYYVGPLMGFVAFYGIYWIFFQGRFKMPKFGRKKTGA